MESLQRNTPVMFQFWPYIKLGIIFWLIIPDFGRAFYVYNNLIRSCISINAQAVICRLNNWRKFFVKKDNFLLHAERYIQENGTEALEKLIASESTTCKHDAETTNAVRAIDNKEVQQTSGKKLQAEHKDIGDLEEIEKKEISVGKQAIPAIPNLEPNQKNSSSAMVEGTAGGQLPQSSTSKKEVQKEWACALCQITVTSEKTLDSHVHGKKHRASCEALKAKNQPVPQKQKNQSKEEVKQKNVINQKNSQTKNGEKEKEIKDHKVQGQQRNPSEPVGMNQSKIRCEVCDVTCPNEVAMIAHLNGKKHLAKIKNLV
ncbi:uncharacterized protein LOC113858381 isoform X2 [Abrus precatorius]|uniref:Uncharacterized protein LOC113858381 isoform X2 n=1 Tax=Abrus precatorius TaxID=3816 RepID=A0A8B8KU13_ABRPR|nr:uncharacterized protein LOC113858381 isoform X2 [Abrus precatorius]